MTLFVVRRILQSCLLVVLMSLIIFVGVFHIGNPVDLLVSSDVDQREIEQITQRLGLHLPLWDQYLNFLRNTLHGSLGNSFVYNEPAIKLILERFPATLELALAAMVLAVVLGIPLGMLAALRADSWVGRGIMAGSILGFSVPTFWVGIMLIMVFSVQLGWLPSTGRGETASLFGLQFSFLTPSGLAHLVMPAINLALFKISLVIRLTHAGVRETLPLDFVKFARAKGLTAQRVILVHVLKNILIPVVTVLGLEFGSVIAFAVVTESIFAWPGMGKLIIDSINVLDRPVIVAYLMITVLVFIVINLLVDIVYSFLDPRVRLAEARS